MMEQFLELRVDELLREFGAGSHAPGSGSATALIGLVAANLTYTVGKLTLSREGYEEHRNEVDGICTRIHTVLIPSLSSLFQEDAVAFDAVIRARNVRNEAAPADKERMNEECLKIQKLATAIPFKIAEACLEIVDHSARLFDIGFRSARGDTGVALTAAVGGVLSAVYVINLNLIPFKGNYWAQQRRKECDQLQKTAVEKYKAALIRINKLRTEDVDIVEKDQKAEAVARLLARSQADYTDEEIDDRAAELRELIWRSRDRQPVDEYSQPDHSDLVDPEVALRVLGYEFFLEESLGIFPSPTGAYEVAGILEALPGKVSVSRKMKPQVRLFTMAHELGHIVLHPQLREAHRDRSLDGSVTSRTPIERQADRFASSYLMPAKLVRARFVAMFGTDDFFLTEATAFALLKMDEADARRVLKNSRGLAMTLATAERVDGRQVIPLANQFKVSPTAMAIRLEELKLSRFDD